MGIKALPRDMTGHVLGGGINRPKPREVVVVKARPGTIGSLKPGVQARLAEIVKATPTRRVPKPPKVYTKD